MLFTPRACLVACRSWYDGPNLVEGAVRAFSQLLAWRLGHVIIQGFVLPSLPGILGLMGLGLQPMM